jgi:hypothetical protein
MDYAKQLAALGYPGFSYLRSDAHVDAADMVFTMLASHDLDVRLVEGLPWVLAHEPELDWPQLLHNVVETSVQNRLGYLVYLALDAYRSDHLREWLTALEDVRLDRESTLCRDGMTQTERAWVRENRPASAEHWHVLTTLAADQLRW